MSVLPEPEAGAGPRSAPTTHTAAPPADPCAASAPASVSGATLGRAGPPAAAAALLPPPGAATAYDCARVILHFDVDCFYAQVREATLAPCGLLIRIHLARILGEGDDPGQCNAKCRFTSTFDRLPDQFCRLLDRLSDHPALLWSQVEERRDPSLATRPLGLCPKPSFARCYKTCGSDPIYVMQRLSF